MLTFITDQQKRADGTVEPSLLAHVSMAPLHVRTLEGEKIADVLPSGPWSHEKLVELAPGLEAAFGEQLALGADAFVGNVWVGSTEV